MSDADSTSRILVTGSRDWDDEDIVREALRAALKRFPGATLVHGACPTGADFIADAIWASWFGSYSPERHPADWGRYKKRAGFVRNAQMVSVGASICLAFLNPCTKQNCPDEPKPHDSHGGAHTAKLAEANGIEVVRYRSYECPSMELSSGEQTLPFGSEAGSAHLARQS